LSEIKKKTLYYRAEIPTAAKRQPLVKQWQDELRAGKIRHNVPAAKPRSGPAELPPKETIPAPPKPRDEVTLTSATEPLAPEPFVLGNPPPSEPATARAHSPGRLPVAVPEPVPEEKHPRIAYPEP